MASTIYNITALSSSHKNLGRQFGQQKTQIGSFTGRAWVVGGGGLVVTTYKVINRSILWRRSRRCNVIDSLCDIDPILSIASHYGTELLLILSDDEALENPSVRHSLRDIVITFPPSMNISTVFLLLSIVTVCATV